MIDAAVVIRAVHQIVIRAQADVDFLAKTKCLTAMKATTQTGLTLVITITVPMTGGTRKVDAAVVHRAVHQIVIRAQANVDLFIIETKFQTDIKTTTQIGLTFVVIVTVPMTRGTREVGATMVEGAVHEIIIRTQADIDISAQTKMRAKVGHTAQIRLTLVLTITVPLTRCARAVDRTKIDGTEITWFSGYAPDLTDVHLRIPTVGGTHIAHAPRSLHAFAVVVAIAFTVVAQTRVAASVPGAQLATLQNGRPTDWSEGILTHLFVGSYVAGSHRLK
jgi:hypothetical protein